MSDDNFGQVTQAERDTAHRLGTMAATVGRGLGGACPYDANGTARQKILALIFVRAYVAAGGVVDGLDYGDGKQPRDGEAIGTGLDVLEARPAGYRGVHRAYGHLGLPL